MPCIQKPRPRLSKSDEDKFHESVTLKLAASAPWFDGFGDLEDAFDTREFPRNNIHEVSS